MERLNKSSKQEEEQSHCRVRGSNEKFRESYSSYVSPHILHGWLGPSTILMKSAVSPRDPIAQKLAILRAYEAGTGRRN